MLVFSGISAFIGWILTLSMRKSCFKTNITADIVICGVLAIIMYLRYSMSFTALKGMLLLFILLYASWSDITSREAGDFIWVMILILSFVDCEKVGILSMLIGAAVIFILQIFLALLSPEKSFGGADIKISTALAFLLGVQKGITAYIISLIIAVIFMIIYRNIKHIKSKESFPLIPFLSIGAVTLYIL